MFRDCLLMVVAFAATAYTNYAFRIAEPEQIRNNFCYYTCQLPRPLRGARFLFLMDFPLLENALLHLCARGSCITDDLSKFPDRSIWYLGTQSPCWQQETNNLSSSPPTNSPSQNLDPYVSKPRKARIAVAVDDFIRIPTFKPFEFTHVHISIKYKTVAIVGGCAGAALLAVIILLLIYLGLMRARRSMEITFNEASSFTFSYGNGTRANGIRCPGARSFYRMRSARIVPIMELEHATSNFCQSNLIGEGGFGVVYKGLLQDGYTVAIKRRLHGPTQYFVNEVQRLGQVCHKHLVRLIGYCQENYQQLLVFKFISNGNVGNYLYGDLSSFLDFCSVSFLHFSMSTNCYFTDSEGQPIGKLDLRQRLSIALGAAKGLEYLHSMIPSFAHMHFNTRNVLVNKNFVAKVSDFGVSNLLVEDNHSGSSMGIDCFVDPELRLSGRRSAVSDVYSFGVFLLELMTGREAFRNTSEHQNLVMEAKSTTNLDGFVDKALGDKKKDVILEMLNLALLCSGAAARRPTMSMVVAELELIQRDEMYHVDNNLGEDFNIITLGSELFS
ncbi:hypothetical protein Sjap_013874 [Stephania japonica]|uniref:non-specific serine/threonine protein kinase n=1 Tax=Stephania japonica TaxID=461633 RepID=A0AAP0IYM2_9MAGN